MRALVFEGKTWVAYEELRVKNKQLHAQLSTIIKVTLRTPEEGRGAPEQLTNKFSGKWSRRISGKDSFVYRFDDEYVYIHGVQGHYHDK